MTSCYPNRHRQVYARFHHMMHNQSRWSPTLLPFNLSVVASRFTSSIRPRAVVAGSTAPFSFTRHKQKKRATNGTGSLKAGSVEDLLPPTLSLFPFDGRVRAIRIKSNTDKWLHHKPAEVKCKTISTDQHVAEVTQITQRVTYNLVSRLSLTRWASLKQDETRHARYMSLAEIS